MTQRLNILAAIFLICVASPIWAATTLRGYSNYFYTTTKTDDLTYSIYAGSTSKACTSTSASSTCDSCAAWGTAPIDNFSNDLATFPDGLVCNSQQIHPNLEFQVSISSDQASMYTNCSKAVKMFVGTNSLDPASVSAFTLNTASQTVTATWTWGAICQALNGTTFNSGTSDCKGSFSKQVQIAFDKDCAGTAAGEAGPKFTINYRYVGGSDPMAFGCPEADTNAYEGFCDFTVYPGDEKVYIYNSAANSANSLAVGNMVATATPAAADASGMKYAAVRFFYSEGSSFASLTPSSDYKDIAIEETSLVNKKISGLTNGKQYVFLAANVDQAGNVSFFSDPQYVKNNPAMSATAGLGDTQSAVPEKVYGLLDNKNCFIATAAYGSGNAADVELLRKFRNLYLLTWEGGRSFVRWYYQVSPPISQLISEIDWLKTAVRGALVPFVLFAKILLTLGVTGSVIFFGILLATVWASWVYLNRKKRPA